MLYINWQGTKDGSNVYTLAAPEAPVDTTLNIGSLTTGALSSYGDIRALERTSASYVQAALDPIPAGGVVGYTGYSILLFVDPKTFNSGDSPNPEFFSLRTSISGAGDGGLVINRLLGSSGNLQCNIGWGSWASEASFNFAWPAAAFWLWIRADPDNATSSERLKYKTWAWDGSVPGSWTSATVSGSAATSGTYGDLDYLRLMARDASTQPIGFGPIVISSDPDEDMTAFLPSSAGATLETPTATSITQTTATIGCTTDSATGTLYGVVTTSATPPSEAQVAAGQDHTGSAAAASGSNASLSVGANTINVTGLTADTTYYSHFVQDEGTAEYSNVLSSTSWQTLATNVGFRITGIQAPDGSGVGSVDPVSVAIWDNSAAAHGSAADTVVSDAAIVSGTLEVSHAGTISNDVLVDVQYSTGSPAVLRSVRGTATLIDLDE